MQAVLDLTPGRAPAIGQRKCDNQFASLHGHRQPSVEVSAPPRGSSSDEESDGQQVPDDGVSNYSECGGNGTREKVNGKTTPRPDTAPCSAKAEDDEKKGLSVEPSNIPAASFTSGTGPNSRNSSQSSQKRKNADVDDNVDPFLCFQKPRTVYGEKAGRFFRQPPSHAIIARVDGVEVKRKESSKPVWRETPSMQTSQRDQRASLRSIKSTQDSSQSSPRIFKHPPRPSPKKVPKSKTSPVTREETDSPRATRSSAPAKQYRVLTEDDASSSSNLRNAVDTAVDKLGMSNMDVNLHASAMPDSSAPPTSLGAATTSCSSLSSLDDSIFAISQEKLPTITSEDIIIHTRESGQAVCPMCKQPVEKEHLEEFSKAGTRMSLRQQARFCKAHTERSAEVEWAEWGYPEIDWQQLDTRITNYHTTMDDILSRRKFSFYRNAFEDSLKGGRNKTLQESLLGGEIEETSPGYYGGRGAKVMADNIMSRFASKLRRLAASDKLISFGGVSRYVQAVLVPELAVLLIKDDMKVDEEKARELLRDSVDIGNLLNEEEDEIITDPAPKESEVVDMS